MGADVSRLPHYTKQAIQPIRFMQASMTPDEFKGFLKGNIVKYVMRERSKNKNEDVAKALVYAKWLDEYVRTGNITVPGEQS